MATFDITLPADAGGFLRHLSKQIQELSFDVPDQTPSGAANVLRLDNNPGAGTLSAQIVSGAYPTGKHKQ